MEETMNEIKRICQRMLSEKWEYLQQSKKYLASVMLSMDQLELIELLKELNYYELKMAHGSGVPGDAWLWSFNRLKELKREMLAYVQQQGTMAHMTTDVSEEPEADESGEGPVRAPET